MLGMKRNSSMKNLNNEIRMTREQKEYLANRRREWAIEQDRAREHLRRKQKMIEEYEAKRRKEQPSASGSGSGSSKRTSHHREKSPLIMNINNEKSASSGRPSDSLVMSERFDESSSNTRLFKGSEGTKISLDELKKIKIKLQRNIDAGETTNELIRDIVTPEEVVLARREGEGNKPIFDREELKMTTQSGIEERRTVTQVDSKSSRSSRRRSASSSGRRSTRRQSTSQSPRRRRSRSPRRDSRYEIGTRSHGERPDYHEESRHRRRLSPERGRDSRRHRSSSVDRSRHRHSRDAGVYEHDRRRYEDYRARGGPLPVPHPFFDPVHGPYYYGAYPRPFGPIDPMMAMRPPMPLRERMPPMFGNIRHPLGPPFIPPDMPPEMYRPGGPHHPRFNWKA